MIDQSTSFVNRAGIPAQSGNGQVEGFIGALAFATIGSIIVRIVLRALEGGGRR